MVKRTGGRLAAIAATVLGCAVLAGPAAGATSAGQSVSGTSLGILSLGVSTPASFGTSLSPGNTATATGALIATTTNSSWTLTVSDAAGANPGHMIANASGCTGSTPFLANSLSVNVASVLGGVNSAGATTISGTPQTVASASSQLLAAAILTTSYSQPIGASEAISQGCVYGLTATYTLQ
jgi:hypothetical protein